MQYGVCPHKIFNNTHCSYNLTQDIIQGTIIECSDKLGNWELGESNDHPIINSPSLTLMMLVTHNVSPCLKQQPLHKLTAWWEQQWSTGQWMLQLSS